MSEISIEITLGCILNIELLGLQFLAIRDIR